MTRRPVTSAAPPDPLAVLVVGAYDDLLADLLEGSPTTSVLLLEEPGRVAKLAGQWMSHPRVSVRTAEYRLPTHAVDHGVAWHAERPYQAVLAGREYAVRPAQEIASALALKGPGARATRLCTDKLAFREALVGRGLTQGRFARVGSPGDVRRFMGAAPVVLKPARQHASIGVVRIDVHDDIDRAWDVATQSHEHEGLARRPGEGWDYLVEDLIEGRIEVSVESLVQNGTVVFTSTTAKLMPRGGGFVPAGHVVPAPLDQRDRRRLKEAESLMLDALGFEDGLAHSEWILDAERLHLVECAARYPGGAISRLISMTADVNLGDSLARACAGLPMHHAQPTGKVCAAIFDVQGGASDGRGSLDRAMPTIVSADSHEALRHRIEGVSGHPVGAGSYDDASKASRA